MKQRYSILQDNDTGQLTIKEFAELDKDIFSLVCEETYDGERIKKAIPDGREALIEILRTPNLYPISEYADKIAEAVTELVNEASQDSVEITFDDLEALKKEKALAETGTEENEESVELDDLLDDDNDNVNDNIKEQGDAGDEKIDDTGTKLSDTTDENALDMFDDEDSSGEDEK